VPLREPVREAVVCAVRARETAAELGLDAHQSERLYRLIIDMSSRTAAEPPPRARDSVPLRVAFLGVEGSPGSRRQQARYGGRRGGALLRGPPGIRRTRSRRSVGRRADVALLSAGRARSRARSRTWTSSRDAGLVISGEQIQRDGEAHSSATSSSRGGPGRSRRTRRARRRSSSPSGRPGGALGRGLRPSRGQASTCTPHPSPARCRAPRPFRFFVDMEGHAAGARGLAARSMERARHAEVASSARIRRSGTEADEVGYAGEPGRSARRRRACLPDAEPLPCPSFAAVFEAVRAAARERGVVPLHNRAQAWSRRSSGCWPARSLTSMRTASALRVGRRCSRSPGVRPGGHPAGGLASAGARAVQPCLSSTAGSSSPAARPPARRGSWRRSTGRLVRGHRQGRTAPSTASRCSPRAIEDDPENTTRRVRGVCGRVGMTGCSPGTGTNGRPCRASKRRA
jgi:hypothetical protein